MFHSVRPAEAPPLDTESSCALALLDAEGRFEWSNLAFARILGVSAESLAGSLSEALPTAAQIWLGGCSEPVRWTGPTGRSYWLRSQRDPMGDKTVLAVQDVTLEKSLQDENESLHRQLRDLRLNDNLTGLPNQRAIRQALDLQISRSRRYHNPLSVLLVQSKLRQERVEPMPRSADTLILAVSRFLRDRLRWVDQVGRWEENIFLVILPETTRPDAQQLINKIQADLDKLQLPSPLQDFAPALEFGLGVWEKGDDMRTLLQAALSDLKNV